MPSKELIDAIRSGTKDAIWGALANLEPDDALGTLISAIVAARDKPEDVASGVIGDWQCYFRGFQKGDRVTITREPVRKRGE